MKNRTTLLMIMILMGCVLSSCVSQTPEGLITATEIINHLDAQMPTQELTLEPTEPVAPSDPSEPTPGMIDTPKPEKRVVRDVLSPDRRWQATVTREFVNGEERSIFLVRNDHNRIVWIVEDVAYEDILVSGFPFPEPFHWSKDGRYLYYTYQSSGDGCFAGGRHKGEGLYRLDLANGEIKELSSNFSSWMALSPDEETLAYFYYSRQGLTLRDLETGRERAFEPIVLQENLGMEIDQRYIVWAPDSQSLMFVVMAGVCDEPESYFNWLVEVDLRTGTQRILFEKDERGIVPILWLETDKVLIRNKESQLWWLSPSTGDIAPVE